MKYSLAFTALAGYAAAYPHVLEDIATRNGGSSNPQSACAWNYKCPAPKTNAAAVPASANRGNCGPFPCAPFNATDQYVSTSGTHAFKAPGATDIRGPCPGLNAAANHGYLSRTGVTTQAETIAGLFAAYAMNADVSEPLAIIAIEQFGDPTTGRWSIGGPIRGVVNPVTQNSGISYSHNNYESDGSQTRCDAPITGGDAHSLIVSRFADTYANRLVAGRGAVPGTGYGYTLDSFAKDYVCKSDWSISHNPIYVSAPFAGTIVAPVAYQFIINFMSNHSTANPDGWLSPAVYKSFFAISGNYPNFVWNKGQERIPDAWYRRPSLTPYDNPSAFGDLAISYAAYPEVLRLGCNNGKVNTYVANDPTPILSEGTDLGFGANFSQYALSKSKCPGLAYDPIGPSQNYK